MLDAGGWELRDPLFLLVGLAAPLVYMLAARPPSAVTYSSLALVDSAATTAAAVAEALDTRGLATNGVDNAPTMRFFATDSPERFARVGAIFLGRAIDANDVELVDLRKA